MSSNLIARSNLFQGMFVWSKLVPSTQAEEWESRFSDDPNLVTEYLKGGKSVRLHLFCASRAEAQNILSQFGGKIALSKPADWNRPPALPKPVKVRDVFLVSAETAPDRLSKLERSHPSRKVISIPPEMAFGTGDHATTSSCLRLLVDAIRRRPQSSQQSLADLGTGTGVLAIAAHKLGIPHIYACDFDPFAVAVAKRNAERNDTPGIRFAQQDVLQWKPRQQGYDFVLANLFSTVLIEAWPVIAKSLAPGGCLIVSGILHSQAWDVFKAAASHGLGFTKLVRKGKWVTAEGGHMADLLTPPTNRKL